MTSWARLAYPMCKLCGHDVVPDQEAVWTWVAGLLHAACMREPAVAR